MAKSCVLHLRAPTLLGVQKFLDPKAIEPLLTPQQRELLGEFGIDLSKVDVAKIMRQLGIDLSQIDLRQLTQQCRIPRENWIVSRRGN